MRGSIKAASEVFTMRLGVLGILAAVAALCGCDGRRSWGPDGALGTTFATTYGKQLLASRSLEGIVTEGIRSSRQRSRRLLMQPAAAAGHPPSLSTSPSPRRR